MARCEVCGIEQYPANTVVRFDSGHARHFFCSHQHADGWAASGVAETPPLSLQITVSEAIEEVASEAGTALEAHQSGENSSEEAASEAARVLANAPKHMGRPPGSKNKPVSP